MDLVVSFLAEDKSAAVLLLLHKQTLCVPHFLLNLQLTLFCGSTHFQKMVHSE